MNGPILGSTSAAVCALAVVAGGPWAGATTAQDAAAWAAASASGAELRSSMRIYPRRTGTIRDPNGTRIRARLRLDGETDSPSPFLTSGEVLLPRGFVLNGHRYPSCAKRQLDREGPRGCPRRSILGTTLPVFTFADTQTDSQRQHIVLVNGGRRTLWAHVTIYNPAFVRESYPISIDALRGRWSYRLSFAFPWRHLPAGEFPVPPPNVDIHIGHRPYSRKFVTTTRRCPKRGFLPYRIRLNHRQDDGEIAAMTDRGRIACR